MKKITFFSKNINDLIIGLTIIEVFVSILLFVFKKTISLGEVAFGHSIIQAYIFYGILLIMVVSCLFLPYLDYKQLVNKNLAIPKLWKKLYVIILPIIIFIYAILISVFLN